MEVLKVNLRRWPTRKYSDNWDLELRLDKLEVIIKTKWCFKKKQDLTLRYTGGGHNDPPSAIYAVEPSKVIRGAQNFGTIPIS